MNLRVVMVRFRQKEKTHRTYFKFSGYRQQREPASRRQQPGRPWRMTRRAVLFPRGGPSSRHGCWRSQTLRNLTNRPCYRWLFLCCGGAASRDTGKGIWVGNIGHYSVVDRRIVARRSCQHYWSWWKHYDFWLSQPIFYTSCTMRSENITRLNCVLNFLPVKKIYQGN